MSPNFTTQNIKKSKFKSQKQEFLHQDTSQELHNCLLQNKETQKKTNNMMDRYKPVLRGTILLLICSVASLVRVFSPIRFESIIHQFDPWFNFRATQYFANTNLRQFWNFFDSQSWYPIGRNVGATVYPGMMLTSVFLQWCLDKIGFPICIRNICVFLPSIFASFTSIAAYLLATQVTKKHGAGLIAAFFLALVPSYMSRSAAGQYDNECISIFALIFTFYLFLKACNTGAIFWSVMSALGFFYMVSSWGGYSFVINMIPIYVFFTLITHKSKDAESFDKVANAYSIFYIFGTLMAMQIPFVKFQALGSSEHMASHIVFLIVQIYRIIKYLKQFVPQEQLNFALRWILVWVSIGLGALFILMILLGQTKWSGRSLTLLDPTYAKKFLPIVASVSQHSPTKWKNFVYDVHFPIFFAPLGLFYIYNNKKNNIVFIGIYTILSSYFACVMVRLLLVFAPAACISGAIGVSWLLEQSAASIRNIFSRNKPFESDINYKQLQSLSQQHQKSKIPQKNQKSKIAQKSDTKSQKTINQSQKGIQFFASERNNKKESLKIVQEEIQLPEFTTKVQEKQSALVQSPSITEFNQDSPRISCPVGISIMLLISYLFIIFVGHGVISGGEMYASPSVIRYYRQNGRRHIVDDYREAYYWIRMNTDPDAVVMAWWDYGYQLNGFTNRTTIVDNNTWNNTHIATVGLAMASPQHQAYQVCQKLGVDYVVMFFGGICNYGDDIGIFLWMVRIAMGVYPHIKQEHYTQPYGYRVDSPSQAFRNSLMYKMAYYQIWNVQTVRGQPQGYDRMRNTVPGYMYYTMDLFKQAYTSVTWAVRIYKRNQRPNRQAIEHHPIPNIFKDILGHSFGPITAQNYKYNDKNKTYNHTQDAQKIPQQLQVSQPQ